MLLRRLAVLLALVLAPPAYALEVQSCDDAHAGIGELVHPVSANQRTFADERVLIYAIDMVEPVCCAGGVAVVMPDAEDAVGGNKCFAVIGVASVQVSKATAQQDADKTLRISIPTRVFNGAEDAIDGDPIKLRIELEGSALTLE